MAKRIKNPMSSFDTPDMGGSPKPTGPDIKKHQTAPTSRKNPHKQRMHADKNWRNNPEHKQTQKVKSKLANEPKVPDVPKPNVHRGAGFDDARGYGEPGADLKGYKSVG